MQEFYMADRVNHIQLRERIKGLAVKTNPELGRRAWEPELSPLLDDICVMGHLSQQELRLLVRDLYVDAAAEKTRREKQGNEKNIPLSPTMIALAGAFELMRLEPEYDAYRKDRQETFYWALQQEKQVLRALDRWMPIEEWRRYVLRGVFRLQAEVFSDRTLEFHPPRKYVFERRSSLFGSQNEDRVFINTSEEFGWNQPVEPLRTTVHEGDHCIAWQMAVAASEGRIPSHSPLARMGEVFMDFFGFTEGVPEIFVEASWNGDANKRHMLERLGSDSERVAPRLISWYKGHAP